jgi:hypothetical protein
MLTQAVIAFGQRQHTDCPASDEAPANPVCVHHVCCVCSTTGLICRTKKKSQQAQCTHARTRTHARTHTNIPLSFCGCSMNMSFAVEPSVVSSRLLPLFLASCVISSCCLPVLASSACLQLLACRRLIAGLYTCILLRLCEIQQAPAHVSGAPSCVGLHDA